MPNVAQQIQSPAPKHTRLTTGSSAALSQAESASVNRLLLPLVRNPIDGGPNEGG